MERVEMWKKLGEERIELGGGRGVMFKGRRLIGADW